MVRNERRWRDEEEEVEEEENWRRSNWFSVVWIFFVP